MGNSKSIRGCRIKWQNVTVGRRFGATMRSVMTVVVKRKVLNRADSVIAGMTPQKGMIAVIIVR